MYKNISVNQIIKIGIYKGSVITGIYLDCIEILTNEGKIYIEDISVLT